MDKAEQYSLLWETYNFITPRLTGFEDRYEKALLDFKQYCLEMSLGEFEGDITDLREEIAEVILELQTYYVRQINIVDEIIQFQAQEKFTPTVENEVPTDVLLELKEVTVHLLNSHKASAREVLDLLS